MGLCDDFTGIDLCVVFRRVRLFMFSQPTKVLYVPLWSFHRGVCYPFYNEACIFGVLDKCVQYFFMYLRLANDTFFSYFSFTGLKLRFDQTNNFGICYRVIFFTRLDH